LVPLTQTSQEAEHWQALEMHNLLLDQETFGTHKREFITKQSRQTKSSRTTFELLPIKTLML
jgi:hypothetical protein